MAISHFIITELPQDIISKIGLMDIVLNQQYDIAMEPNLKFERIPELDGYFLTGKVKFKAYDNSLEKYGNEAIMNLIWKESNLANLPASADVVQLWVNDQSENLLSILPINQAVEFIEIVSIEGVNNLMLNGQKVLQGHRLAPADLLKAVQTILIEGGGFPYFVVSYQVGRGNTVENTVYTFTINVESIAALIPKQDVSVVNGDFIDHLAAFEVEQGYQNGTAYVEINIQCSALGLSGTSEVRINANGVETVYTENTIVEIPLTLNELGKAGIVVFHKIASADATGANSSTVNLININGNPAVVSPTQNTASIQSNF